MNFSAERFAEVMSHLDPNLRTRNGRDKRRAQRLSQRADLTIIPYTNTGPSQPKTVQLRDFSTRGVRMLNKVNMKHGEEFIVMLPRQSDRPIPMLCTVVHCVPVDGGFSIGAEFVCVAPADQPTPGIPAKTEDVDRIRQSMLD